MTKSINQGGAVHPFQRHNQLAHTPGMTMRQMYACAALIGIVCSNGTNGHGWGDMAETAEQAWDMADAMIRTENTNVDRP